MNESVQLSVTPEKGMMTMDTFEGTKRLYKSRTNRMIDGVCGGVAEYFGLDPTLVRIAWVLLTVLGGSGILLYIAAMIIMPTSPLFGTPSGQVPPPAQSASSSSNQRFWGFLLVAAGIAWLMSNLGIWHRWWGFSWDLLLPTALILAGVAFLFGGRNYVSGTSQTKPEEGRAAEMHDASQGSGLRKLYRSRIERKLFGVCGGVGSYFGIDPTIIRLLFLIAVFASFGLAIFAYIVMAIIVPDEPLFSSAPGGV
jgi:phage shock protein C